MVPTTVGHHYWLWVSVTDQRTHLPNSIGGSTNLLDNLEVYHITENIVKEFPSGITIYFYCSFIKLGVLVCSGTHHTTKCRGLLCKFCTVSTKWCRNLRITLLNFYRYMLFSLSCGILVLLLHKEEGSTTSPMRKDFGKWHVNVLPLKLLQVRNLIQISVAQGFELGWVD